MSPALHMILAGQRVADLLRGANAGRPPARSQDELVKLAGASYRLPDGSWIYRRRDSS
jgi:hypothetical protein